VSHRVNISSNLRKSQKNFSFFLRLSQKTTLIGKKKKEKLFADRFERDLPIER
jgi:hypothetical protein